VEKVSGQAEKTTSGSLRVLNAGGEGSSGQADVRLDETTSVKPEAAACCSPLPETVEAVPIPSGDGWCSITTNCPGSRFYPHGWGRLEPRRVAYNPKTLERELNHPPA
jgi:hypothetical protein